MSKPYIDPAQATANQERAMRIARERLEARGVFFPVPDSRLSDAENYERLMNYSEIEAKEIVLALREPSGPRPLVIDTVKPRPMGWDGYND